MYHAAFEGDEMVCFEAPVTELVWITPQPGVKLDEVVKMVTQAVENANNEVKEGKHLHMDGGEHECFGATWGRVVEKDMLVYIAGWSSIEVKFRHDRSCRKLTDTPRRPVKSLSRRMQSL